MTNMDVIFSRGRFQSAPKSGPGIHVITGATIVDAEDSF